MNESIIESSRTFFAQVVQPILQAHFPAESAQTAFGIFGYGSEALGLDDEYSRDHHWGLRIDALMPPDIYATKRTAIMATLREQLPATYRGHSLREGHLAGAGLAPDNLQDFLLRTIGIDHVPQTDVEWLQIPEADIIHIINGEVWSDPLGEFTAIRTTFQNYYPEPVRLRRIAHACRFFSGMGTYALKRAMLRDNEFYATTRLSNALQLGIHIAFLLDKRYAPYDKWLIAHLARLPRLGKPLLPLIDEAAQLATPWERKLELLHQISDLLDETLVADGIIQPHPRFQPSPTSGYRLLEHAYAEILQGLPPTLQRVVPVTEQIYMEAFHSDFVARLDLDTWDEMLQLEKATNDG